MNNMINYAKKNGFTLVELLAVIAILAILVIIALPNVIDMFTGARENAFKVELQSLYGTAKKKYMSDMFSSSSSNVFYYSDEDNQLPISGGDNIKYSMKVQSGKILCFQATNGLMYYTGTNIEDAKDIKNFVEVNAENPDITPDCSNKTTIYVSADGINTNDGKKETPVKTIAQAVKLIGNNEGKIILLSDIRDYGTTFKNNNVEIKSSDGNIYTIYNYNYHHMAVYDYDKNNSVSFLSNNKIYNVTRLNIDYDDEEYDDEEYDEEYEDDSEWNGCYGLFCVEEGATLTTSNIKLDGRKNSTPVRIEENGTYIMNNGTHITGSDFYGGCVYSGGTFIMNGGTIDKCEGSDGSSVLLGNKFIMNGGTISNGYSYGISKAATIYVQHDTYFEMNGGVIKNNRGDDGGAIHIWEGGSFKMTGGIIENNTASRGGGAIYSRGLIDISGGTFINNTEHGGDAYGGGAILLEYREDNPPTDIDINIKNAIFKNNTASSNGAVTIDPMNHGIINLNIDNCTFDGNVSNSGAAALSISYTKQFKINNSTFINNTGNGSGALSISDDGSINNSTFKNNMAKTKLYYMGRSSEGGAIRTSKNLTISNSNITGNKTESNKYTSLYYGTNSNITLVGTTIDGTCGYYNNEIPCSSLVSR